MSKIFISLLALTALALTGCAATKSEFDYRGTTEKFSSVEIHETCVSHTSESVGPKGMKGVFNIISGVGTIRQPRGEINCTSAPFTRTMTKSYE